MKALIRQVKKTDIEAIVQLEAQAFKMTLEQTKNEMLGRIENYPDTFLVAEQNQKLVGYIFGPAFNKRYIEDRIYFENHPNFKQDKYQMILSLVVAPEYRRQKIATNLINELEKVAKKQKRQAISLTCFPKLIPFYEQFGFKNEGQTSEDIPDPEGLSSFNMVKEI